MTKESAHDHHPRTPTGRRRCRRPHAPPRAADQRRHHGRHGNGRPAELRRRPPSVRDDDGRCTGLLTRLHLAPFQARSWYTERTPVRDIVFERAPFATADMPAATAAAAMRLRDLEVWPVVDHDGHAVGLLSF
ncbi:hypothetical protein GXW82_02445 [Streptacidiphilus sp. 4-A2]|nr:hypothetical protein [Streptacidiphilus sp. 4-A2]